MSVLSLLASLSPQLSFLASLSSPLSARPSLPAPLCSSLSADIDLITLSVPTALGVLQRRMRLAQIRISPHSCSARSASSAESPQSSDLTSVPPCSRRTQRRSSKSFFALSPRQRELTNSLLPRLTLHKKCCLGSLRVPEGDHLCGGHVGPQCDGRCRSPLCSQVQCTDESERVSAAVEATEICNTESNRNALGGL